ncbi:MAG: sigma-70 family RNA polymerase sigma factor [Planctomycetes bacterium]|nr:sigma-70 family RNA polymerase sigma factor [Planctomycetota bacterium]
MSESPPQTTLLLDRWHAGEREALDQLLEQHLPWIRQRVHARLGPMLRGRAETGDFVQESLLEFLRWGPRFRIANGASFRALLARICEHVLCDGAHWWTAQRRDIARERSADSVLSLDPPLATDPTPSELAEHRDQQAWVHLGLELLSPDQRRVVVLRHFEHLPFADVGAKLDLAEATARKRYERAMMVLTSIVTRLRRGEIEQLCEDTGGARP